MTSRHEQLREALRRAAAALTAGGPPFALGGSYALWVHGAPEPLHDVDLVVAEDDAERAAEVLAAAGFEIDHPPEGWLFKARVEDALVDVLFRMNGVTVARETVEQAEVTQVLAVPMRVLAATHVVTVQLLALDEHYCDLTHLLPAVRAVREQLDWPQIAEDTAANDYAAAFLFLAERLGISPPHS